MSNGLIQEDTLTSIADAIREKNGSSDTYYPSQMPQAIREIKTLTHPDWSQNDSEADDYIKNRTHYTDSNGDVYLLDNKYIDKDYEPYEDSDYPITSGGVYEALQNKQNALTFDNIPQANSNNPVYSKGLYEIWQSLLNTISYLQNQITSLDARVTALEHGEHSDIIAVMDGDDLSLTGTSVSVDEDGYIVINSALVNVDTNGILTFSSSGGGGGSVDENGNLDLDGNVNVDTNGILNVVNMSVDSNGILKI